MPNYQLLTSNEHKGLRVHPAVQNEPHFVQIVTSEFATAATSCPIMFTKDPATGNFFAGVVLSLRPGDPPIKDTIARGGFVPLSIQFNGFYIADQHIAIDRDNPRFSESDGELLFTDSDQPGDYLRQVQNALGRFHAGIEATNNFIRALMELKLVELVDMTLNFDSGERLLIDGLYTVTLDGLRELDDATVLQLFRAGHLELAYTVAGSLKQFGVLAHLRNQMTKNRSGTVAGP
jgi:hypothetical protein